MLSSSPKILLLGLALLTFTTALHPSVLSQELSAREIVDVNFTQIGENVYQFNGYDISECGSPHDPKSKAKYILGFLFQMKSQLERVIADARLGTHSEHGYAAFFKSNRNIRKVIAMFERLVDATPIIVDEDRVPLTSAKTRTPQPQLKCFNEADVKNAAVLQACNKSPQKDRQLVLILPGTEMMIMCPTFFTVIQYPAAGALCPELKDGKVKSGDAALLKSAFAYVVYALVNMYDRSMMGGLDRKVGHAVRCGT